MLYSIDITNLDVKFPRASEAVGLVAKSLAVYVFFVFSTGTLLVVFATYVAIFFFINMVIDRLVRYRRTPDLLAFTGIYIVIFFVISATTFGTFIFGEITSKLGGAKPHAVSIALTEEARKSLPPLVVSGTNQLVEGKLVHQTSTHTYVESAEHTVRLRTTDVVALVIAPDPAASTWTDYVNKFANSRRTP